MTTSRGNGANSAAAGTSGEGGDELLRVREILVRRRWIALGVFAFTVGLALIWSLTREKIYTAATLLRIDTAPNAAPIFLTEITGAPPQGGTIETEMLVLKSRQIAEAVVDTLGLQVEVTEPEFGHELVEALEVSPSAATARYRLELAERSEYEVDVLEFDEPTRAVASRAAVGIPFVLPGVTLRIRPTPDGRIPRTIELRVRSRRDAAQAVRENVAVSRPNTNAQLVAVSYRDPSPYRAAAVANAVAHSFIAYKARTTRAETRSAIEFLRDQVASYHVQLSEAEVELRDFRERFQVISPQEEASEQVQRLAELQAERDALRAERDALRTLLAEVESDTGSTAYRQLASYPVFLSNRAVQDLLQSITQLENERAELLVTRMSGSIDVQGVDQRIADLERQLLNTAVSYLQSVESQLASIDETLSRFGEQLERIPAREVEFARRLREQSLLEDLFALLQTRLKEAEIRNAGQTTDVLIVDEALVPEQPSEPNTLTTLLLAVVFGAFLALAAAMLIDAIDTKVRTREEAQQIAGDRPVLALIPRIVAAGAESKNGGSGSPHRDPHLISEHDPWSPAAEAYRSLRTAITFSGADEGRHVVIVTSAMPGDGKSTTAANLALVYAKKQPTLLVDADLRRGGLHRLFGLPADPGLSHVLVGSVAEDAAIRSIDVEGSRLDLLPAGVFPPNPAELLDSDRMARLLEHLRTRYATIVIDSPPLNLVTDAALLGAAADASVLVTRLGRTDKRALDLAVRQMRSLGVPITGLVLNDMRSDDIGYGSYGSYRDSRESARAAHG